ncbi:hypothetical protein LSO9J_50037 [Candidatus Liberibacter solanacearum]
MIILSDNINDCRYYLLHDTYNSFSMVSIDFLPMHLVILKEESVNITSSKTMVTT